jgi:hypothetical protein
MVTTAAWSVPVIAVAVAAPSAAASPIDAGAYTLAGTCGVVGILGPGFTLRADAAEEVPVGTTVVVTGTGVAYIGVFTVTGGSAIVTALSPTSRLITLTAALPAGATLSIRTTLSTSIAFVLNAVSATPAEYVATGAKTTASVTAALITCTAA